MNAEKKVVRYCDFGAKGDGVTDDFAAIYAAHEYANAHGLPVECDDGKTYYIHDTVMDGEAKTARIMTDVNWGSSKFIIDDTDIDYHDGTGRALVHIFHICSPYQMETVDDPEILAGIGALHEGDTKINLSLGYPALVLIYNEDERVYHRSGAVYAARGGQSSPKHEILLIDKDGNIDSQTPFMFNYEKITKVEVIRCDVEPITLKGGTFTHISCRINALNPETGKRMGYFRRGFYVNRSDITIDGVEHYIKGEFTELDYAKKGLRCPSYCGFFNVENANNVLIKNCVLTARRHYDLSGTYDLYATAVNKLCLENCTQSNFTLINSEGETVYSMATSSVTKTLTCFGICASNFCKNMEYIRCKLSRFDAHQGLLNGRIKDSTINFMEIIGKGEMILENVTWCSPFPGATYNTFAYLRGDYGSTWEGTVTMKDCTFNVSSGDAYVFPHNYVNWNFGYTCYIPNLIIDNPTINGLDDGASIYVFRKDGSFKLEPNLHLPTTVKIPVKKYDGTNDDGNMTNMNPIVPPKFMKVINNNSGYDFYLPKAAIFDNTEKVGIVEIDT